MEPDEEMRTYAQLAQAGYKGAEVEGYDIDRSLSNRNRTVYVNRDSGKATISFSGTRLGSKRDRMKDIGTDVLLATGLHNLSSRFKNAKKVARATMEKYGTDNVDTVGHSLGGSQSLYVNQRLGLESHSFNAGAPPSFVKKSLFDRLTGSLFKKPVKKNATAYYTGTDPISMLSPLAASRSYKVKPKTKDPHSMANFL
jgi:hypothetical protein